MRLIDADELKARVKKASDAVVGNNVTYKAIRMTLNTALLAIDVSPTITPDNAVHFVEKAPTVEERKHGRWLGGGAYYCSNCHMEAATDTHRDFLDVSEQHYCYNCGAIMDGDEE